MKLKFSGNNLNIRLADAAGEPIYSCLVEFLDVEVDIAKLIEAIDEIQQAIFSAMEKAANEED